MSQTIKKAIPVLILSGSSSLNAFLKLSTAFTSLAYFRALVISAFSLFPSDDITTADFKKDSC